MTTLDRAPLSDVDWFARSGQLAIADVVFVKEIWLCSHQLDLHSTNPAHRMMDIHRNIYHTEDTDRFFVATRDEICYYWENLERREC